MLVTGANRGIGKAIALGLAKLDACVFALGRNELQLNELKEQYPNVTVIVCDITESKERLCEVLRPFHPFHCLVNNAGVGLQEQFLDVTEEWIDRTFAVNFRAPLLICQLVAKEMIKHQVPGSIVNVSSIASLRPLLNHTVYGSSKAALDMMTRVMAKELGAYSIRANVVNPTVVMTDMGRENWSDPVKAGAMLSQTPLKQFAEPEDVVNSVLFLLSDQSSMTTGMALPVDGGFTTA